jgi:hypothetical protein
MMLARIRVVRASTLSACLIPIAKNIIEAGGRWQGIDDVRILFGDDFAYVWLIVLCMASLPPHWQLSFSSQVPSGWFSQAHPMPKQIGQFLFMSARPPL